MTTIMLNNESAAMGTSIPTPILSALLRCGEAEPGLVGPELNACEAGDASGAGNLVDFKFDDTGIAVACTSSVVTTTGVGATCIPPALQVENPR